MSKRGPCPWNAGTLVEETDMQTIIPASTEVDCAPGGKGLEVGSKSWWLEEQISKI